MRARVTGLLTVVLLARAVSVLAAEPAKPKANPYAEERKLLLGTLPPTQAGAFESVTNAAGDYVYEATSAKPLVEGRSLKIEPGTIVKGLTTAVADQRKAFLEDANLNGMYWRLHGIRPGRYWIGVVCQSGAGQWGAEAMQQGTGVLDVHLNGRMVPCPTMSDPVQVAPGVWFSEAQAGEAVALREGDEVGVVANLGLVRTARLILHSVEFQRGAHRMCVNPGPSLFTQRTSVGISADATFVAAPGKPLWAPEDWSRKEQMMDAPGDFLRQPDGRAVARCMLANPLPVAVEVDYICTVRGYYRQVAGQEVARLKLAPHSLTTREVPFVTTPDDPAYSITTRIKAMQPPGLGWPAYDALAFFPGLRHLIPWADPFEYLDHRRVYFRNQGTPDARQRLLFNDAWEMAVTAEMNPAMPPPAALKFEPQRVPFYRPRAPQEHSAYVRRKLVLPEGPTPRACRLVVEAGGGSLGGGISSEGTLYVNGQRAGNVRGRNVPLVADVTRLVHPGTNEVVVLVRDVLAVMNPQYVNLDNPVPSLDFMDAPGDCNAGLALSAVWAELTPEVAAEDIKVETSVRRRTIGTRFALENRQTADVRARVKVSVLDAGQPLFTLGEQDVWLKPGAAQTLAFTKPWRNPRLWSWKEPNLYVLAVDVTDAATGKRLDLARTRFGFKESWLQGSQIMFNGHPVRLKSMGRPYTVAGAQGCLDPQVGRSAANPDFTDETGDLATELVTGLVNTSSKHNVASDVFWEAARQNALANLRRKWNHPSILAWDLSNEWFCYAVYSGADMALAARRFKSLSDAVIASDPTRWTFFNGDGDLNGLHNNYSGHYMCGHHGLVSDFDFDGHSHYLPDGMFFRPLDRDFARNEGIAVNYFGGPKLRYGSKVIMDTENLWKVSGSMPPGPCKFVGEEDVLSSAIDLNAGPWVWMWKQNVDAHRDLGMALHSLHEPWQGVASRGHLLQTFIMPDTVHHGFSGRKMVRAYSLHNDLFRSAQMKFTWQLVGPDGHAAVAGADTRKLGSGDMRRGTLAFKLPQVAQRTEYTLQLRLESEGRVVCGEDRDIAVWPDTPVVTGPLARKLAVYDPMDRTVRALSQAGAGTFVRLDGIGAPSGEAQEWLLVIGEGALNPGNAKQAADLIRFVEAGGRVLVLAQNILLEGLPAKTLLETREWSSQPFVRLPIHPVLDGLTSWDLHFWAPDRVSARGAYAKPAGAAAIPLVDSGTEVGLEWVQMMELYRGKGLYLLCQLPVVANHDQEPMARELLARMLRYAGGRDAYRAPVQRLRVMAEKNSATERRLQDVGVAHELVSPDAGLDRAAPTLVVGGSVPSAARQAAWKAGLAKGATLVLAGVQPADAVWLSELAGLPVTITVPRYRMWEGRGYRNGFDPLTAGLSHLDLYWKEYDASHVGAGACQTECPDYTIEPFQDWSVSIAGAQELVFPGALTVLNVGEGRLIVDQRRWTTPHAKLARLAERNLSSLALGLNVGVAPCTPPPALPEGIAYRCLDLAPLCNRGFADAVAGDGKGGWSDQGPTMDVHEFPTGRQTFNGVPFLVGREPRGCIVLKSEAQHFSELLPEEATIPVDGAVEGLWFLHSAAYSGNQPVALYQIRYADGTSLDIPLLGEENIRDWVGAPGSFPREKGTQSKVAWTGTTQVFPVVCVLQMLWVNPRPQMPVKNIRFTNPEGKTVPILIAVTAAIKRHAQEAAAARAKAQEVLAQAQQALDAKQIDVAKNLLRQAVDLDDRLWSAYEKLADLAERGGTDDEKLEVYRAWTAAAAPTPLPFNRLGELLERRKDFKGALEAYTQSLRVEWNQPPVIAAKSRLEQTLSP